MNSSSPEAIPYNTTPTTISNIISRSLNNLTSTISRKRPWSEFLPSGSISLPDSLSSTITRLKKNLAYFQINHAMITASCTHLALVWTPIELLVIAMICFLWLVLYFFRDEPLVLWGYNVSDMMVLVGLGVVTVLGVWWTDVEQRIVIGVAVALMICVVHGVLRSTEGLFLDEDEAIEAGLVGSGSRSGRK